MKKKREYKVVNNNSNNVTPVKRGYIVDKKIMEGGKLYFPNNEILLTEQRAEQIKTFIKDI